MTLCNDLALWSNISPCRLCVCVTCFTKYNSCNDFLFFSVRLTDNILKNGFLCTFLAFTLPWYGKKPIENCYCEIYSLYGFSCLQCFTLHVCKAYNVKIQNIYYGRLITPLLLVFFSENKSLPTEIEN